MKQKFGGIFPHPRPLSQRERGERKYEKISASVLTIKLRNPPVRF